MSRRLSRNVSCAKAMHRYWSRHEKLLTLCSPSYLATQRRNVVSGKCCVSCAKTSLPSFIGDPRDKIHRRVAETVIRVQIETREKHELCVPLQRFTKGQPFNVRT